MAIITEEQIDIMSIDGFIFHVVHHGGEKPILLEETPIGEFESFFIERVRDTLRGNSFQFIDDSPTEKALRDILRNKQLFVDKSKELALDFHRQENKKIKPGVLMLMLLSAGDAEFFSIIKYDHEQVLHYQLDGNNKAFLREITNSFTKSKASLHKAAFICLENCPGELAVLDQTVRSDITNFFKGFLCVKRKHTHTDMTKKVQDIVIRTTNNHTSDLPIEFVNNIRKKSYDVISSMEAFDEEECFNRLFGEHAIGKIRRTYKKFLKKYDLEGESFKIDMSDVKPPKTHRLKTKEGVRIAYDESNKDKVKIEDFKTGKRITIETDIIIEQV